jgi:hypothetical protein
MRAITRGLSTSANRIGGNPELAAKRAELGNLGVRGAKERALRTGSDAERSLAGGLLEFTKRYSGTTLTIVFDPKSDQMVSVVTEDASGQRIERDLRPGMPGVVERMRVTNGLGAARIIEVRAVGGVP